MKKVLISARDHDWEYKLTSVDVNTFDKIIFNNVFEYEYTSFDAESSFNKLLAFANSNNKSIQILNGGTDRLELLYNRTDDFYKNILPIEHWSTSFITSTYFEMKHHGLYQLTKFKFSKNKQFTRMFVSMNSRPHFHRCLMMDLFAKYNLIEDNFISWRNTSDSGQTIPYSWRYWKTPQRLMLSDDYINHGHYLCIPDEYNSSFINVISESNERHIFLTEKTATALFLEKPFIVFSSPYFYDWLTSLGFELYDELFDYSFDAIINIKNRYEHQISQLEKLNKLPIDTLHEIYLKLEPKLIKNRKLAEKIATSINYFTPTMIDMINHDDMYIHTDINLINFIKLVNDNKYV